MSKCRYLITWLCNHLGRFWHTSLFALIKQPWGDTPGPPGSLQSVTWDLVPFSFNTDWYQEYNLTKSDLIRAINTLPKVCSVRVKKEKDGEHELY